MKIYVPVFSEMDIPFYYLIPILWFVGLWTFAMMYVRCECGDFYHTKKEKKEFINFVWFSILSTIVIFVGFFVWKI